MKSLIIFDSEYGNTEKIAAAISEGIAEEIEAEIMNISKLKLSMLQEIDVLVIGSPTQGGRPTKMMQDFIDRMPEGLLKGKAIAVFDTRFLEKDHNIGLRIQMKSIGYAADKMEKKMKLKGIELVIPPEGFIVDDKEGPIKQGEVNRALEWGKSIIAAIKVSQ